MNLLLSFYKSNLFSALVSHEERLMPHEIIDINYTKPQEKNKNENNESTKKSDAPIQQLLNSVGEDLKLLEMNPGDDEAQEKLINKLDSLFTIGEKLRQNRKYILEKKQAKKIKKKTMFEWLLFIIDAPFNFLLWITCLPIEEEEYSY